MRRPETISFMLLFVVSANSFSADDRSDFRGPKGDGSVNALKVPVQWSVMKNVAWKRAVPSRGWSTPVMVGA